MVTSEKKKVTTKRKPRVSGDLVEGTYGPYKVKWTAKDGLWTISATTLRAIKLLKVGTLTTKSGVSSASTTVRSFGDDPKLVKKAADELNAAMKRIELAQSIEMPEIYDLTFGVTDDGLIRVSGTKLRTYRDLLKLKPDVSDKSVSVYEERSRSYFFPETISETFDKLRSVEALVRSFSEKGLPLIKWVKTWRNEDLSVGIRGPLLTFDGENLLTLPECNSSAGYRNKVEVSASTWISVQAEIIERVKHIECEISNRPFSTYLETADSLIEVYNKYLECNATRLLRDGPWLLFQCGFIDGGSYFLNSKGFRWCYVADAWGMSLLELHKSDPELEKFMQALRDLHEYSFILIERGIKHRSFRGQQLRRIELETVEDDENGLTEIRPSDDEAVVEAVDDVPTQRSNLADADGILTPPLSKPALSDYLRSGFRSLVSILHRNK